MIVSQSSGQKVNSQQPVPLLAWYSAGKLEFWYILQLQDELGFRAITTKDMPESPLIAVQILGHQLLGRWLLWHVLSTDKHGEFQLQFRPKNSSKYRMGGKGLYTPAEEGIRQHVVLEPKTHHGYSYQRPSEFYRMNAREIVVVEVVVALSPQRFHLAGIHTKIQKRKKNHKQHISLIISPDLEALKTRSGELTFSSGTKVTWANTSSVSGSAWNLQEREENKIRHHVKHLPVTTLYKVAWFESFGINKLT